ncbi:MAG: prepilin-type N-terminal cleavage/methylation domain-containing protein [Planctomycetota bacterium]
MSARRGFTLIELLLALSLLSILILALVRLLDTSLTIWDRTEGNRDVTEMGLAVTELLVDDLEAIEGGPRGDLLADWVKFDTDGDDLADTLWPRLRLVRASGAADLRRQDAGTGADPGARGLVEVCWALLPTREKDPDRRTVGVLWRGERRIGDEETLSFFAPRFFTAGNAPAPGSLNQVTGGVLWLEPTFAAQTSVVRDGWKVGSALADCAASWDAWGRERPDVALSDRNEPAVGMPAASDLPLLPRRIQVRLEIERPAELRRRTRLDEALEPDTTAFRVRDERRLPEAGTHIRIDEEWMAVVTRAGAEISVRRGQRGTRAAAHAAGALLHHGFAVVREVAVPVYREDWNLGPKR